MKILKFGGTSVGSVESLLNVKAIVEAIQAPVVVVVSALGGLTDKLIATAGMASSGDERYREEMELISSRHFNIISNVVDEPKRPDLIRKISHLLSELKRNYDGIFLIRDLPQRTLDVIVSFGERMSAEIVAAMIENSSLHNSLNFIKTEKWYNKNIADQKLTTRLIKQEFSNISTRCVVPGFISTDRNTGDITNLGRGGSDFTAALIASSLNAEILEIWTDVDGFMTADPRIIAEASVVPHMTFIESMDLCNFGAKVIYPPTIYPVFHKNIPIKILNTFHPEAEGTLITDSKLDSDMKVKGISSTKGTSLLSIRCKNTDDIQKVISRTFNKLSKRGINVFLVTLPGVNESFSFAVAKDDSDETVGILEKEFAPEIASGFILPIEKKTVLPQSLL